MGMFDYVKCEFPLPDDWKPNEPMQTKDFNCLMTNLVLTADGRLLELVSEGTEDTNFHGFLRFYGYNGDPNEVDIKKEWHEYKAKFTDGKLVAIEVVTED